MRHGKGNLDSKRPRYHPVIAWEQNNLTNDFVDINRVALDDRYGKVGASLYKEETVPDPPTVRHLASLVPLLMTICTKVAPKSVLYGSFGNWGRLRTHRLLA